MVTLVPAVLVPEPTPLTSFLPAVPVSAVAVKLAGEAPLPELRYGPS